MRCRILSRLALAALIVSCAGESSTLRLRISADPSVGALDVLVAMARTGTGNETNVLDSVEWDVTGRDLADDPLVVEIVVPKDSSFAGEASIVVQGRRDDVFVATAVMTTGIDTTGTVGLLLVPLAPECDADGDGFRDCAKDNCCVSGEENGFADCDDGQAGSTPFAKKPECRCPGGSAVGNTGCADVVVEGDAEVVEPGETVVVPDPGRDPRIDALDVVLSDNRDALDVAPDPTEDGNERDVEPMHNDTQDVVPETLDLSDAPDHPDGDLVEPVDGTDVPDVCQPDCTGAVCGDDGCGGSCGECAAGKACVVGACICPDECSPFGKKECTDTTHFRTCGDPDSDTCLEWSAIIACGPGGTCQSGLCTCTPSCAGKECGDNGCGGSCGGCTNGEACEAGQCVCAESADDDCDAFDDDCDGQTDEGFVAHATACGVGACQATGEYVCIGAVQKDTCAPGLPADNDAACNNVEDFVDSPVNCGLGACVATGWRTCAGGITTDACIPATEFSSPETCNGVDDDCDGEVDEGGDALCLPGLVCFGDDGCMCIVDCTGKECGEDGCGGSCGGGRCVLGQTCVAGTCTNYLPSDAICKTSQCFPVPPTGQTTCYDNSGDIDCPGTPGDVACGTTDGCGQDGQYADNARAFSCYNAAGALVGFGSTAQTGEVVADSLTGLMWQRTTVSGKTWQEAQDYCTITMNQGSGYGGHTDWRVPNPLELRSLVDHNRKDPAIDATVFPGTDYLDWFWSSPYYNNYAWAWYVSFREGEVSGWEKTTANNVRCVRSGPWLGDSATRFYEYSTAGDTIVVDVLTGLEWQKDVSLNRTWNQALKNCEASTSASYSDWHLPDANELASITNYGLGGAGSDFPGETGAIYWSSSSNAADPSKAWYVTPGSFISGTSKTSTWRVRCVRRWP